MILEVDRGQTPSLDEPADATGDNHAVCVCVQGGCNYQQKAVEINESKRLTGGGYLSRA